ncbi:hypothetical protein GGX14DRAFT_562272 [Mycena pura]|uniref:Uncharacterized protein n=1 Tax=Mycena pura TaxID=153505 RepID=A0AAD6VKH3_9AGAR|nr:hypothetical protein GGX14DRAFT_562272 [Mycena pura]
MPHRPPALQSQPHLSDVLCIHLDTFPSLAAVWLGPHLRTCAAIRDRLQAHTLGCALRLAVTNLLKWRMGRRPHQALQPRDGYEHHGKASTSQHGRPHGASGTASARTRSSWASRMSRPPLLRVRAAMINNV